MGSKGFMDCPDKLCHLVYQYQELELCLNNQGLWIWPGAVLAAHSNLFWEELLFAGLRNMYSPYIVCTDNTSC